MDFCKFRSREEPSGPYGVCLPLKARDALAARDLTLFITQRLNWAEDGLRVVIGVILSGEGKVSDYLRISYPDTFAECQRRTETNDTRRTLLYRLRYLLRCLVVIAGRFAEFHEWQVAGFKMTIEIFTECVRQALGEQSATRRARMA